MKSIALISNDSAAVTRQSQVPGLLLGLVLAGLFPMGVSYDPYDGKFLASIQIDTAIGCCAAIFLGYVCYRKLAFLPGLYSGGYVLMSMTGAYAVLAAIMLMLRLDYSRIQLTTSFLLAVVYFFGLHMLWARRHLIRLGVIAGGRVKGLPEIDKIRWEPLQPSGTWEPSIAGVVVDLRADHSPECASYIAKLALAGVPVYHVSDALEQLTGRVEVAHLSENTLGSLNPNHIYLRLKSVVDRVIALALLILLLPIMIIVGIAIRLESPGPALFVQRRTGFRAQSFRIYKFRTMIAAPTPAPAPDDESHRVAITAENDPRITRIGRFLRRSRLDELPQLINIVLGDMSFIGPRPEAEQLADWYANEIPFYHYRHIIKPGLTGWAQVNQGHVAEIEDVRLKLHLDFYYVKYFSFWLDLLITSKTIRIVFSGHGAK